jgi:hypothetical protein
MESREGGGGGGLGRALSTGGCAGGYLLSGAGCCPFRARAGSDWSGVASSPFTRPCVSPGLPLFEDGGSRTFDEYCQHWKVCAWIALPIPFTSEHGPAPSHHPPPLLPPPNSAPAPHWAATHRPTFEQPGCLAPWRIALCALPCVRMFETRSLLPQENHRILVQKRSVLQAAATMDRGRRRSSVGSNVRDEEQKDPSPFE